MRHTRETLKARIALLEAQHELEKQEFSIQLKATFTSLKLTNLIKSAFRELTQSTLELKGNVAEAIIPLLTNYVSGRIVGKSGKNSFFRVIATIAQMALTNFTAKHSHAILEYLSNWVDNFSAFLNRSMSKTKDEDSGDEAQATDSDDNDEKQ